jgi:hypothetical protein
VDGALKKASEVIGATMRKTSKSNDIMIAAALAGVLAMISPAAAQYRVGSDGRANDASNRVGSNGYNDGGSRSAGPTANQIVTGNVTGGREFRGPTGSSDPRAFRGATAGEESDRFIRGSSGVPVGGVSQNNASNVTAFYGSSRATPPPPGFQQQGFAGTYIPAPANTQNLGDLSLGGVVSTPQGILPPPGDLVLRGPTNDETGNSIISASPLYGIRLWKENVSADRQFVDRFSQPQRPDRAGQDRLDQATLERYRSELQNPDMQNTANVSDRALPAGTNLNPQNVSRDSGLASGAITGDAINTPALDGKISIDQSTRNELVPPAKQSALYAQMVQRFSELGAAATDQEAQRRFAIARQMKADAEKADKNAVPGMGNPADRNTGRPGAPDNGGAVAAGGAGGIDIGETGGTDDAAAGDAKAVEPTAKYPVSSGSSTRPVVPLHVRSLADGVKAPGLASLLTSAEESMRAGQFGSAIDRYDTAAKVAPNNPLITLGRAIAEMGASYYSRAEGDLRKAFTDGPALTQGQYDLVSFLGAERLQFVIKDLKQIANENPQQATPTFLLAYIARSMGNDRLASDYLHETEKRLGGADELITNLRKDWRLPEASDAAK